MTNVFATYAPKLWKLGHRVVPIRPGTKRPSIVKWEGYVAAVPSEANQAKMLEDFDGHGIGLLLGAEVLPGKVVVALDIDDDLLVAPVRAVLPHANVAKRGQKGQTLIGLMDKEPKQKSTTFKGASGVGNIDFLATGRQTVLSPTIHPDTGQPYGVIGHDVADVAPSDLPQFDEQQITVIRTIAASEEIVALRSGQTTHDAGVKFAAKLVRAGGTDEQILAIFQALLPPNYTGNSLEELPGWIQSARDNGWDQDGSDEAKSLTERLVAIGKADGVVLFHDSHKVAYASVPSGAGRTVYRLKSVGFQRFMRHRLHEELGKPVSHGPLSEAIATLEALAVFEGEEHIINLRVAGDANNVEIDLGHADGRCVKIKGEGWVVAARPNFHFLRSSGFLALPEAVHGGDLRELQKLLSLDEKNFRLLVAFLINALRPSGPYQPCLIEGQQGSGKSVVAHIAKTLIDPNEAMRMRMPDTVRDLMVQAKEFRLLNFDNASHITNEMSDALCTLSTGGGIGVRALYTDGDLNVLSYSRPIIMNGITGYANRPDLLERAIPLRLPVMPETGREREEVLMERFRDAQPRLLGALYDGVAAALKNRDSMEAPKGLRMADAALWIAAAEPAFGFEPGSLVAAVKEAQEEVFIERVNDDPVVIKLRKLIDLKPFEDYVGTLFDRFAESGDRNLPKTPSALSKHLVRLAPAMTKAGLVVEFREKTRYGRRVWIGTSEQHARLYDRGAIVTET